MIHTKLTSLVRKQQQRRPNWKAPRRILEHSSKRPQPAESISFAATTNISVKAVEPAPGEPDTPASPSSPRSPKHVKHSPEIAEPAPTDSEEDPHHQITKSLSSQFQSSEAVSNYIKASLAKGEQPLPILTRITAEGELFLLNYKLNAGNSESFSEALSTLVPETLKKVTLMDNGLTDKDVANVFAALGECRGGGLASFSLLQNCIGNEAVGKLARKYFGSAAATHLKKLSIKNPVVVSKNLEMSQVFEQMEGSALKLVNMNTLRISQLKLDKRSIRPLVAIIKTLPALEHLDLSATGLNGHDICELLSSTTDHNSLKSLNLSYNITRQPGALTQADLDDLPEATAVTALADFIHYSDTLLHIDLGGMSFSFAELEHIFVRGLRKSRTLQSCHIVGANRFGEQKFNKLMKILKIEEEGNHEAFPAVLDTKKLEMAFEKLKQPLEGAQLFAGGLNKQIEKQKMLAKAALAEPLFSVPIADRIVFERTLGHPEILGSHRWKRSTDAQCAICNKLCYCVFIWNYSVQGDASMRFRHWKQCVQNPIRFQRPWKGTNPVIAVNGHLQPMLRLDEFMDRLEQGEQQATLNFRACDNAREARNR